MEKYCIKFMCYDCKVFELMRNQGLRYLIKDNVYELPEIILFSDDSDKLYDAYCVYDDGYSDNEDELCETFNNYCMITDELPLSYFKGFN